MFVDSYRGSGIQHCVVCVGMGWGGGRRRRGRAQWVIIYVLSIIISKGKAHTILFHATITHKEPLM